MGVVRLPQRFLTLPQYEPQLADAYSDAEIFSLFNDGTGKDIAKGNDLVYPASPPTKILQPQGYALNFDGSDRLVSTNTFPIGNRFTVFAWVRPDFINYSYARIAETAYTTGFYLGSNNGNSSAAKYAFIVKGASLEGCIGGQQVIGQRDFVCGTYNGTNRTLYLNGEQVATATASAPSISDKVYIGHNSGGVNFWRGDVDTFAFYQRAFSAEEVQAIYQQPGRLFKAPQRRIFVSAAPSSIDLTGASSAVTNIASTAAITQTHVLVGSTSTQGNLGSVGAVTLGAVNTLVGAASAQGNAGSSDVITQTQVLTASTSTNNGTSSAVAITLVQILAGADSVQGNLGGTGAISILVPFVGAPSTQPNISSSGQITRPQTLTGANSTQANLASTGAVSDGIVVEAGLTTGIAATVRIKKPGIPAGTPDWLRNLLEILIGRRGNRIQIPEFQTLTFSATPTKAECEALYAYVNEVRTAVNDIITRLDS